MLLLCNFQVSILVDLAFPPLFYFPFTVVYINEITAPIFFNLTFLYFLLVMVPLQNVPLVFRPRQRLVEPLFINPSLLLLQDLKDLMRKAGDVTYADAHKNRKNEGVVEFASRRDMERAIDKFDDYDLNGRRIKVRQRHDK